MSGIYIGSIREMRQSRQALEQAGNDLIKQNQVALESLRAGQAQNDLLIHDLDDALVKQRHLQELDQLNEAEIANLQTRVNELALKVKKTKENIIQSREVFISGDVLMVSIEPYSYHNGRANYKKWGQANLERTVGFFNKLLGVFKV